MELDNEAVERRARNVWWSYRQCLKWMTRYRLERLIREGRVREATRVGEGRNATRKFNALDILRNITFEEVETSPDQPANALF